MNEEYEIAFSRKSQNCCPQFLITQTVFNFCTRKIGVWLIFFNGVGGRARNKQFGVTEVTGSIAICLAKICDEHALADGDINASVDKYSHSLFIFEYFCGNVAYQMSRADYRI